MLSVLAVCVSALLYKPSVKSVSTENISVKIKVKKQAKRQENFSSYEDFSDREEVLSNTDFPDTAVPSEQTSEQTEELDLNVVYPPSMRKRNIEAFFEVKVHVNKEGYYELEFPSHVQQAFINAIEKAFKGKRSKLRNADYILPVEFCLK